MASHSRAPPRQGLCTGGTRRDSPPRRSGWPRGYPGPTLRPHRREDAGAAGTRFAAHLGPEVIGYIEVDIRTGDTGLVGSHSGLADIGNLWVSPSHRRNGVGRWLVGQAAAWLRLGHADRLLNYVGTDDATGMAFATAVGFTPLTTTTRGWRLNAPGRITCLTELADLCPPRRRRRTARARSGGGSRFPPGSGRPGRRTRPPAWLPGRAGRRRRRRSMSARLRDPRTAYDGRSRRCPRRTCVGQRRHTVGGEDEVEQVAVGVHHVVAGGQIVEDAGRPLAPADPDVDDEVMRHRNERPGVRRDHVIVPQPRGAAPTAYVVGKLGHVQRVGVLRGRPGPASARAQSSRTG
ncbi:MAG: GNAT family N-acetyltransferase [Tessaracoccus sp.]|nr:GNAT family N-acetyltransferase [Tessaracoccus sp.]